MDYCIYNVYREGRNAVEDYLCDSPPDPDSDDMTCLRAMQHATYTALAVLGVEPGVGCHVRNLYTDELCFLVDISLSQSAPVGAILATRLLDFGDYIKTGGAAISLGVLDEDDLDTWSHRFRMVAGRGGDGDPAPLIRAVLQDRAAPQGRLESVKPLRRSNPRLASLTAGACKRQREDARRLESKPAGNRRCRCGSGKMFKNCCGKH
jgi:hypothetical protein